MTTTTSHSIDPALPASAIDKLFINNVKTTVISALKASINNFNYPDLKLQELAVSMEYPMIREKYPHLWVEFSFTKLQQHDGFGGIFLDDNGNSIHRWYFEGNFRFTIMALKSFERDAYASQLIQLLAFGDMDPVGKLFHSQLTANPNFNMELNKDVVLTEGQLAQPGTPWNTEEVVYQDTYRVSAIGELFSGFTPPTLAYVEDIEVQPTGSLGGSTNPHLTSQWTDWQ